MANNIKTRKQKRLREIEDRKIEILLETGRINDRYGKTISRLDSEYKQLDEEYYQLQLDLFRSKKHKNKKK
jgi:hypothetical protein